MAILMANGDGPITHVASGMILVEALLRAFTNAGEESPFRR